MIILMERLTYAIIYICVAISVCIGLYVTKNPLCLFAFWFIPPCRFWLKNNNENSVNGIENKKF